MRQLRSGLLIPEDVPGYNERPSFADIIAERPDMWVNSSGKDRLLRKLAGAANQPFFQPIYPIMTTSPTAITGTAEAAMWPVAPFTAIPANTVFGGQLWVLFAYGIMTTPGASPGTLTITPRWGTTTGGLSLGASAASATLGVSQTNVPWNMWGILTVRSVSNTASSSSMVFAGVMNLPPGVLASNVMCGGTVVSTADTTNAAGLFMGATMGSASDSLQTQGVLLASIN